MRQYPVVYENKTAEAQSAQRTNERRRLLLRSKYAILFKCCNKMNFTSLRTLCPLWENHRAMVESWGFNGNKTTESQSARRTNDGDDYCYEANMQFFSSNVIR